MTDTPVGTGTVLAGRFVLEDLVNDYEGAKFWRATDRILARNVAVHVVDSEDPRAAALLSAARTSATVSDGHLLRVLDAARADGVTYVVNEWGHGMSLDRLLEEGPLSPRRAAWVAPEPRFERGYGWMFQRHVGQANDGCDFDYLARGFGRAAGEPDIF